jgi:carbon-monoxide dehydrogenase medium subunit
VASGATLVVTGPDGDREIRADAFYSDAATGLEAGELLREIRIPSPPDRAGSGYLKMAQRATGFTICGVAAVIDLAPDGTIQSASIGITGVGRHAFRATLTEQALLGQRPDPETLRKITADAASGIPPIEDCHASGAYRSRMAGVFTTRAIGKAVERIRA